jgi:pyrroline-5-carboxylate reductase
MESLGFIGTGAIASAMVDGLRRAGVDTPILLSPRNAAVAAGLAARHAGVRVADDNQAVLDGSDMVVLAVRPQDADAVLSALRFRPDHHVLSLIATLPLDAVRAATAPAGRVTRAVPLPAVAEGRGATAMFPADDRVQALFDRLGSAFVLDDESAFDLFTTATATMASYFAFAGTIAGWMERGGIATDTARAYTAQMLEGLALASHGRDFAELAQEHQTLGGINEQVIRQIAPDGTIPALAQALDGVLTRLRTS